jgi:hypothetical protein
MAPLAQAARTAKWIAVVPIALPGIAHTPKVGDQIFVFPPWKVAVSGKPPLSHTTLGRSRSYQSMSMHHEATTGDRQQRPMCHNGVWPQ